MIVPNDHLGSETEAKMAVSDDLLPKSPLATGYARSR